LTSTLPTVEAAVEAAVSFVPHFPITDVLLVSAHHGRDILRPVVDLIHREGVTTLGAMCRAHEDRIDFEMIFRGGLHELVAIVPPPRSLRGLKPAPFGEEPHRGDASFGHFGKPLRMIAKRAGGRADAPGSRGALTRRWIVLSGNWADEV